MVTIATWNLENLFRPRRCGPKDQPADEAKLDALASTIIAINPDVLALQEVGDPEALEDLTTAVGDWHTATSKHPDNRGTRVGFFSRHPLTDAECPVAWADT